MLSAWSGAFGRPLTDNCASMPERLELRGSRLFYSGEWRLKRIKLDRLLDDFLRLGDQFSSPPDALAFARKYGPLFLCEHHGIAAYHKPLLLNRSPLGPAPIFPIDKPFKYDWCGPRAERGRGDTFSERIEVWFKLTRRATSLLRVASAVRTDGNAPEELWEQADGFQGSFKERFGSFWAYLDNPSNRLAANLDCWIVSADVCLRVRAENRSLVAALGGNSFSGGRVSSRVTSC